ncbi:MAG: hypothetical protein IPP71_08425 [Bacteroidetes bacterium]|nr:hypothetical protein [Bacteroidota bacterium]
MNKLNYLIKKARSLWQFAIVLVFYSLLTFSAHAQLANVPITGFTNDLVANGTGDGTNGTTLNTATTGNMNGMVTQPTIGVDGVGYTFIDATYKWWTGSVAPACYLPTGGAIPSAITSGLTYQLQSYSAFNAMTIVSNTYPGSVWPTTGTVTLTAPSSYTNLYVLYESVMNTAGPTITATVTFTDATTQVFSGNTLLNWFTATGVAYTPSISRAQNVAAGAANACATGPYLFQMNLALSAGNYGKTVQSISFNWSAATGAAANTVDYFHVLALGGLTPCAGTPTPGNTLSTANPACPSTNFTLSMQNGTGGGATYQWQSSLDGSTWTDISGATSPTRVAAQTVSTYYQCVVTCGANTGTSTPIQVNMAVPLNGTYTINSGTITGGTNFQTFTALKDILNCVGVSGPVTVNVVAASGPYTEQVQFNAIPGASATNTITINGNSNTLTFGATLSTAPGTLVLNGTDYMTVNNLTVAGTGGTYAFACHLYNQADNNTFSGCTFNVPANCTNTTQVPFSISGSATSATTSGVSGNNNIVTGCTIFSGYYNTCFVGNSAGINTGNQLINCNILDQYLYATYFLYQNGMVVRGNTLSRPTRTSLSTYYGLYVSTSCINMLVEKNQIRNTWATAPASTGTQYCIYNTAAGTSGSENLFYNNLVSDINFNGTIYGLYFSGSNYLKAYHNTLSFDQTGASGTTTTYAIYSTGTLTRDFRNNVVTVTRGGTGTKYCTYMTTPATVTSNNNNLYMNSAAGTNYVGYNGTNYATLSACQSRSGKDANSVSLDPVYTSPITFNYTPTTSPLNDIGAALGILTDITGAPRSGSTPDPGAYEFSVGPCAGTPTPGNTVASSNPTCPGSTLVLSLQNFTLGSGVTYQWQTSPDGSTWTNVSGANSSTYSLLQTTATYYQCLVTCSTGPSTGTSTPVLVNQNPASACYCTPTTTGGGTYYISNFTTTGGTTNINNTSASGAAYTNFFATVGMSAVQNTSVNWTMTIAGGSTYGKAIWVDWNQDGTFSAGEQVASSTAYASSPFTGSFTVPLTAIAGTTRMRMVASFTPANPSDPCTISGSGEYEDYAFTVIAQSNCSGIPAPGNTLSSSNPACANSSITLSFQNTNLGTGISYQWQTSPDGSTWTNVSGATSLTYVVTQTTATYYQCIVTCSFGSSGNSTPLLVTQNPLTACYCTPNTTGGTTYYISNLLTTGGTTNINNTSAGSATGYQNFFSTASMSAMQGTSVNFTMTIAGGGTYGRAIWIDFNQDGVFGAGEQVVSSTSYVASPISGSFTVPLTAIAGTTRMRILASFTPNNPSNPCANSGTGEYEDYAFDVIPLPNCVAPPASVTSSMTVAGAVCGSGSKTLTLSGITPASGLTYQWQESVSGTPGTFVNVTTGTGGTTNTFTTATLTSSMYYLCEVGCSFGGGTTLSSSTQVVVSTAPTLSVIPLSGTNVCSGSNVDLSASGALTYSWSVNPGVTGYPIVSLLSTPNNTATVTSRPTSTLASGTGAPPATVATPTWTYTVVGTAANGCTSSAVVVLNVITTPVVPLQLTYTNSPDPVCAPGTPITFTVNNPGSIGAGTWTYNWYDQTGTTLLQSTTNALSTDTYTPSTPVSNGNYIYTVKVTNSLCPSSYAIASPTYFVGYTSLNVGTNAKCGDNGVLNVYPEGQTNFSTWYSNNFNTGLNGPAFDALYGNAVISSGLCNITTQTNSQNGTLLVRNPAAINTNNLQVDFKLSTAPRGFAFNILGADGLAWSYAPDVWQGQLTPGTGGFQAEGGSGTGFKLAFDATANGAGNTPGCYLMYNCTHLIRSFICRCTCL